MFLNKAMFHCGNECFLWFNDMIMPSPYIKHNNLWLKSVFAKDGKTQCKRWSFTLHFTVFCKPRDKLLQSY